MNQRLALRILGEIMNWDDERARDEFRWLRLMGDLKYDGYQDFRAGSRFVERLVAWLQQFAPEDREVAYAFVRTSLVYIGPSEMERLVEQFYPRTLQERLVSAVADELEMEPYLVRASDASTERLVSLQRQTLFMGLSDGARLDVIRHHHAGILKNEQFVQGTQIDDDKWTDLLGSLREDLKDESARFKIVILLDDFVATGTTFVRHDDEAGRWKGKLRKFHDSLDSAHGKLDVLEPDWILCIHHYLASKAGSDNVASNVVRFFSSNKLECAPADAYTTFGMILPEDLPVNSRETLAPFVNMTNRYYDSTIETRHTAVGGVEHLGLGYGGCALPVVLDHNTPNNSIALLWAETDGESNVHGMVPLFRRRQRHQ